MNILFLTYDVPYPLISGGKIRAYHLLKNLARSHQITLFSYYRDEEQKKYIDELKKYCRQVFFFKRRKVCSWQNIALGFLTPLPFAAATYYSNELKQALMTELETGNYHLAHFESFYPALYLPLAKKRGVKTLMGNENIEWRVYDKYASQQFFLLKWILKLEVFRMRIFEEKLWKRADINIAPSESEAKEIENVTKRRCLTIPNGVDLDSFKVFKRKEKPIIVFVGTLIYRANSDAVSYFLREIYPKIKKELPRAKFILVSWFKPKWLGVYLKDTSIEFIQDKETPVNEFFKSANVLVAPMRVAGGTRIKILEAMAAGLPVVTTSVGIEGIKAKSGQEVIIVDRPKDFAKETIALLTNKSRQQKISAAGRKLVERIYDWEKIGGELNKIYEKA